MSVLKGAISVVVTLAVVSAVTAVLWYFKLATFGPEHPDVATNLANRALLYAIQGRYAEAEPLSKRALAIHENALGPDHPFVAANLTNLAALYDNQGRYADSEPLYKRALAIQQATAGSNHPNIAITLGNLANLYQ